MRRTGLFGVVSAVMTAALLVVPATPANATVTGGVVFECTAHLNPFPAPPPRPSGSCSGSAIVGVAACVGIVPNACVIGGTNASFNATFDYDESCGVVDGLPVPPPEGAAEGDATISNVPEIYPNPAFKATIRSHFEWTRVGLVAVIITGPTSVTYSGGTVTATVSDVAVALFVPDQPVGDCSPGGAHAQSAEVYGVDIVAL